jgi:hypothetical protein
MRNRLVFAAGLAAALAVLMITSAWGVEVRYCNHTEYRAAYLIASYNVGCGKAQEVAEAVVSSECVHRTRCTAEGFACRSYNGHDYSHPFSATRFGTCHASRRRHVEFDFS